MSRESSATDFFSWQDYARRQTTRLLLLFGLSVLAIILTLYLVAIIALGPGRIRSSLIVPYDLARLSSGRAARRGGRVLEPGRCLPP